MGPEDLARELFFEAWNKLSEFPPTLLIGVYKLGPQLLHTEPGLPEYVKRIGQMIPIEIETGMAYLSSRNIASHAVLGNTEFVPMLGENGATLEQAIGKAAKQVFDNLSPGAGSVCVFFLEGSVRDSTRKYPGWEACGFSFLAYSHRGVGLLN